MFVASPYCGVFKEREESTHIQRDDVVWIHHRNRHCMRKSQL
jgi:hypothetical protein